MKRALGPGGGHLPGGQHAFDGLGAEETVAVLPHRPPQWHELRGRTSRRAHWGPFGGGALGPHPHHRPPPPAVSDPCGVGGKCVAPPSDDSARPLLYWIDPANKKPTVRSPWGYSQHNPPPPPPQGGWVGGILFPGYWLRATGRQEDSLSGRPSCAPSEAICNTPGPPPPHTQTLPRAMLHPHLQYPSPTLPNTNKTIGYSFGDVCLKHELFSRTPPWYMQASYQVSRHPPGLEECRGNRGENRLPPLSGCTSGNRIFSDICRKHTHCETF